MTIENKWKIIICLCVYCQHLMTDSFVHCVCDYITSNNDNDDEKKKQMKWNEMKCFFHSIVWDISI